MKAGDVVKLKSGSPAMTIAWVNEEEAYCEWFDGNKPDGKAFPLTSLYKV